MTTFLFHDLHDFFAFADKGRLSQRSTDVMTFSQKERVGNTAADNQGINQRSQMLQNGELRGNLGTADDSNQRTFGFGNSLCQSLDFFGKQRTSAGDFGFAARPSVVA